MTRKSAALVPLNLSPETRSVPLPELVMVTFCGVLTVDCGCMPNVRLCDDSDADGRP
jgi:hypothetical protein